MSALKPYWGKPAVRNFREGYGNGGIMRSPLGATTLLDFPAWGEDSSKFRFADNREFTRLADKYLNHRYHGSRPVFISKM
jgi:hypothetical protein